MVAPGSNRSNNNPTADTDITPRTAVHVAALAGDEVNPRRRCPLNPATTAANSHRAIAAWSEKRPRSHRRGVAARLPHTECSKSISGTLVTVDRPTDVCWLNMYDSYADVDRVAAAYASNTRLMAALHELSAKKSSLTAPPIDLMTNLRSDFSGSEEWRIHEQTVSEGTPGSSRRTAASSFRCVQLSGCCACRRRSRKCARLPRPSESRRDP
jgi:hypothetical protein